MFNCIILLISYWVAAAVVPGQNSARADLTDRQTIGDLLLFIIIGHLFGWFNCPPAEEKRRKTTWVHDIGVFGAIM